MKYINKIILDQKTELKKFYSGWPLQKDDYIKFKINHLNGKSTVLIGHIYQIVVDITNTDYYQDGIEYSIHIELDQYHRDIYNNMDKTVAETPF
jgi:hypothetical protein